MAATQVKSFDLHVSYGQAYLADGGDEFPAPESFPKDHPEHPVGIIRVEGSKALLVTGLSSGPVGFSAAVSDEDPGADTDGYEDIVEISYWAPSNLLRVAEWGGEGDHVLPRLPSAPGWYRLRYHAVNMDEGCDVNALATGDAVVDRYLLQVWPQPESAPRVIKSTSHQLAYWCDAD
ncbi:hypothetical protein [Planobispora takensis]|uniref:Uncharacterized protein n=1 Tax=Planobispora takensis TaxID=1367882 RepID=A0A8J3SZU5_9ACTN|nr:hypothetical protein [Planobispora takensis]GII03704.1 hypothetical protein Pta02_57120 [Planobispora takensis]